MKGRRSRPAPIRPRPRHRFRRVRAGRPFPGAPAGNTRRRTRLCRRAGQGRGAAAREGGRGRAPGRRLRFGCRAGLRRRSCRRWKLTRAASRARRTRSRTSGSASSGSAARTRQSAPRQVAEITGSTRPLPPASSPGVPARGTSSPDDRDDPKPHASVSRSTLDPSPFSCPSPILGNSPPFVKPGARGARSGRSPPAPSQESG